MAFDDSAARNLEQPPAPESNRPGPVPVQGAPKPEPANSTPARTDKEPMTTDDFATALETFTPEAEAAVGEDHIVKGTVLKVTPTHVVVDIGAKSEGMLPIAEVLDHSGSPKFKAGDEIDVMIEKGETEEGYTKLSHLKAQRLRARDEIERAHDEKRPIKAVVIERIKGGLTVDIYEAQAFLPGSQ